MSTLVARLAALKRLLHRVRELFSKDVTVRYSSVPVWKPWRDY